MRNIYIYVCVSVCTMGASFELLLDYFAKWNYYFGWLKFTQKKKKVIIVIIHKDQKHNNPKLN